MEKQETKPLTVHGKMAQIKSILSKTKINKSGYNEYAGFKYHELADFIEHINKLNFVVGVNDQINIDEVNNNCSLTLVNTEDKDDHYTVSVPFTHVEMLAKGGAPSNVDRIQRLGSTITYIRRYLYMTAYNIQESDGVDSMEQPTKLPAKEKSQPTTLTEERFNKALDALEKKQTTVQEIEKYDLTEEQKNQLSIFTKKTK